ncbi:DUF1254 domain-containing protein [Clostridioides difficile]
MNKNDLLEIVKNTYIYGYPIVGMYDLLYTQIMNPQTKLTNFNEFAHTATVASPKTSFIPAPNNDTTYSRAWLDLREEPVIIEVPNTNDRYYSIQLLDLFTETITNIGRRLTGTEPGKFVIIGPDWVGNLPQNTHIIKSNTPLALAFLRILINDKNDIQEIKDIQTKFKIYRLSQLSNNAYYDNYNTKYLPTYKNSNYHEFFETLSNILSLMPKLNIEPNVLLSPNQLKEFPDDILTEACDKAKELINNELPPVSQFWSLTMYLFKNAFLVDNEIDRYSIGDCTKGLVYNEDGSLIIYIQNKRPKDENKIANWLPSPTEKFYITLRLYGPREDAICGKWLPPVVTRVN